MKVSSLDLNWPEVTLMVFVILVAIAAIDPDILWVVVEAVQAIIEPLGALMAKANPFKG